MHFSEAEVQHAPLVVGAIYEGSSSYSSDPISKLLPVKNQGGIRPCSSSSGHLAFVALHSTGSEIEWPDDLNRANGIFRYYGDNRKPENGLLDTSGNKVLLQVFSNSFSTLSSRLKSPPFFIFSKPHDGGGKPVKFEGIAVPGNSGPREDWCVAKLFPKDGKWYQNFVISLTMLAVPQISKEWIQDLQNGNTLSSNCPIWYRKWVETGAVVPLIINEPSSGSGVDEK